MYAMVITQHGLYDSFDVIEVSDRSVELAFELRNEQADEETVDQFLDNCEEHPQVCNALHAVIINNQQVLTDNIIVHEDDQGTVVIADTETNATNAYYNYMAQ